MGPSFKGSSELTQVVLQITKTLGIKLTLSWVVFEPWALRADERVPRNALAVLCGFGFRFGVHPGVTKHCCRMFQLLSICVLAEG